MRREGCAREEVRLPSHPSTIYRGKGRGGGALGFPLGGGGQADWISLGKILGRLPPSQAGGGLPPKPGGGAPPPQVTWERVWGAHHPLVGWFAPSPLAHEALQHLPGLPKHLSVMLAIAWYPRNTSGLQYPSSNISIFTSGPFRSSSSRPGSHPGLRTTFGNHILFPITTLASPNLKCVDPTGSGTMQT